MNRIFCIFILFFLFINIGWASPASILNEENLPPQFEAIYNVQKQGVHVGKMRVRLEKNGDEVIYESSSWPIGMAAFFLGKQEIIERAILKVVGERYRTVEFKHAMKDSDKNRDEHYIFDWENNKANIQYRDKKETIDIPPYTFDNFSTQLLLMRKPNTEIKDYTFSVISKGRLKQYIYKLESTENIETKLGNLNTNKFIRVKDNEKKTTYLGWYAESLNYIPVKLDKLENGKIDLSIQITEVNWL